MKLKYQWPLVWSLLCLTYFREALALPAGGGSPLQHLLWPLVHANVFHWLLNTLCFMALWRIVTIPRLLWAYASSVLIGYLWCWCSSVADCSSCISLAFLPMHNYQLSIVNCQLKLCGLSSIIFFLLGIIFVRSRKRYRLHLSLLILISCFIPNIAASVHILSLLFGILYTKLSVLWHRHNSSRPIIYSAAAGFVSCIIVNYQLSIVN